MNKFHFKKLKIKKTNNVAENNGSVNSINSNQKIIKHHKKVRSPKHRKETAARIIIVIVTAICVCFLVGVATLCVLLIGKPKLNPNDFVSSESSIIYDRNGEIVSELGQTIRKNITYDDLPTSLIDAFVAVEDSRFFEHNGFDIPRFTKAFLENIRTMSFGQGGSTFTMQLIKNTYFVDDEAGVGAAKSIKRKVQEIALAIELENNPSVSKKDIFTAYLNKLYFGGNSQNIRGVQKAAEYYFGKEVNDLTLPESAMLAGVINAPTLYNPYNYLEYAQERRDEVLYLMYYHGYISENEYEVASKTKVEDLLSEGTSNRGQGNGIPYQAYIDEVVEEVYELTGLDPYTTSMKIYTAMDKNIQTKMDEIQAGKVDEKYYYKDSEGNPYFYPDEKFEVASICIDNETGEIYGILGGRNYADGGALLLNHATQQYKQPGSSIKPILDYSQAFEVLGWSTSHIVTDRPVTYPGTSILVGNSNGYYQGDVPLKHAVYESLNTTAILALQAVIDNENGGSKYLSDYMNSIGFNVDPYEFNVQYAIGGSSLEVSPLMMAGAQAMLINHGKYNKPHTVTKIEFFNEKPPLIYESKTVQALSPEAAYLTTELLKFNVSGNVTKDDGSHYGNYMELLQADYQVYAKTGTSNWDSSAKVYGIPNGSIKDGWMVASTSKVTTATWMGYEKAEKVDGVVYGYMPGTIYNRNLKGKIAKMVLNESIESFGKPKDVEKPEGVQSITHITIAGTPYVAPIEGMPEEFVTTGLIKKSAYSLTDAQTTGIEQMNGSVSISYSNGEVSVTMPTYPIASSTAGADRTYDISLYGSDGNLLFFKEPIYGRKSFDYAWLYGTIKYKADLKVNGNVKKSAEYDGNTGTINIQDLINNDEINDGDKISVSCYYGFDSLGLNSNKVESPEIIMTGTDNVTFTVPATKELAESLLNSFGITLGSSLSQPSTDSSIQDGTLISITLIDGTTVYTAGQSVTINKNLLNGAIIKYYTVSTSFALSAIPSPHSTSPYNLFYKNEEIKINVPETISETIGWQLYKDGGLLTETTNYEIIQDGKTLHIDSANALPGSYIAKATIGTTTATYEFVIEDLTS